jgi:putative ABC transport system permease protein
VLLTLREQFIHGVTGHIMVAKTGYYDHGAANPFDYLFQNSLDLQKNSPNPGDQIDGVIPRLQFGGLLTTDQKTASASLLGVDPHQETLMRSYGDGSKQVTTLKILSGSDLDPNDAEGILIGRGLAKTLKVSTGDALSLLTTTQAGSIDGANYRVRGIFESPIREFDNQFAKVNLKSAQKVLGVGDSVTSLLVMLRSTSLTDTVQEELAKRLSPQHFEVLNWEERGDFYRNGRDLLNQINVVVQIILTALILFSIASSVNMTFFERMREFGTMMALGNSRSFIFFLISVETLLIACLGVFSGLLCGVLASFAIAHSGLMMPPLPGSTSGYEAYVLLTLPLFLKAALVGLAAALVSSLVVSGRTSRLTILNAIGHV